MNFPELLPNSAPSTPTRKTSGDPWPVTRSATAPVSQYTMPSADTAAAAGIDSCDEYAPITAGTPSACKLATAAGIWVWSSTSRTSRVIRCPATPPAALTICAASVTPRYSSVEFGAVLPDSGKIAPIFRGTGPAAATVAHAPASTGRSSAPISPEGAGARSAGVLHHPGILASGASSERTVPRQAPGPGTMAAGEDGLGHAHGEIGRKRDRGDEEAHRDTA